MRSYLMSSGFEILLFPTRIFSVTERLSKVGRDHLVFNRLLEDLKARSAAEGTAEETPYFRVLQTSSSHEPF